MSTQEHIRLAQSLPPRLLHFFARFPPSSSILSKSPLPPSSSSSSGPDTAAFNPFARRKHPISQKWHEPSYSLRRQADLVKLARENKIGDLLPRSIKDPEVRATRRETGGLRVKGTGVGQRVKGKTWERTMKGRLETRRQAMLGMPALVQKWKQVSQFLFSDSLPACLDWIWRTWENVLTSLVCSRWDMDEGGRSGRNDSVL